MQQQNQQFKPQLQTQPQFQTGYQQNINKKYSNKWIIYLAVIAVIGIITAITIRILTPPKVDVSQTEFVSSNIDQTQTEFTEISYTGSEISISNKLPIVKVETLPALGQYLENQLIVDFNLTLVPELGDVWQGKDYSMALNAETAQYTLVSNSFPLQPKIITKEDALAVSNNFIATYFSNISIVPIEDQIEFLSDQYQAQIAEESESELINIPYSYQIQDYPVYYKKHAYNPFSVLVNSDLEIQKVKFQTFFISFNSGTNSNTINIEEAVSNINNNQASIIYAEQVDPGQISLEKIRAGELTEVSIEYRVDETLMLAYPFYRFKGTVTNDRGVEMDIELITPAIETKQ